MNEQAIKVLARFTEVGQWWPKHAWIYYSISDENNFKWHPIKDSESKFDRIRMSYEICELEANQKGIFRDRAKTGTYYANQYG